MSDGRTFVDIPEFPIAAANEWASHQPRWSATYRVLEKAVAASERGDKETLFRLGGQIVEAYLAELRKGGTA